MTLAFTICSINYLAQARTLGDSLKATNPDWQYVIGLVDKLDQANLPDELMPVYPMIEVDRIEIPDFSEMCDRYDITELNTAVKPYYIDYLFRHYPEADEVIYFDPDIIVYQPLIQLANRLKSHNLVLTPHMCSPTNDWLFPNELNHLNTGTFNLGFIGLRRSDETLRFVKWWQQKLAYECRIDLCNGLFVDQHWVNFAPVFFDDVFVERHAGYNMAYWNLHERQLSFRDNNWYVNDNLLLQFFHFSGYSPYKTEEVSKYQDRFTFEARPDIVEVFEEYKTRLLTNRNDVYRTYPCFYIKPPRMLYYKRVREALKTPLNQLISVLEKQ